jgi:hypothetical protein
MVSGGDVIRRKAKALLPVVLLGLAACGQGSTRAISNGTAEAQPLNGDEKLASVSFSGGDTVIAGPDKQGTVVSVGQRDDGICVIVAFRDGNAASSCGKPDDVRAATLMSATSPSGDTIYFAGLIAPEVDALSLTGTDAQIAVVDAPGLSGAKAFSGSIPSSTKTSELVGSSRGDVRVRKAVTLRASLESG